MSVYIIAEAGVNHNGDIKLAKKLVDIAKNSGCDCVKFQAFKAGKIVTKTAARAEYQIKNTKNEDSQFEMLKKLELSIDDFQELKQYCKEKEIDFLSSAFDEDSVEELDKIGVDAFKLSSGEITNKPLIQYVASKNKKILLSTGMSTLDEVEKAVDWIKEIGNDDIVLFHCTSEYPASYDSVNMNAMSTLKEKFRCGVGYSDHTRGIEIPLMAVAMGAQYIEKHFTYDSNADGPDHKASLEPEELAKMVESIRNIEQAFGNFEKIPNESEMKTREVVRKSLVWAHDVERNHIIEKGDICCKRPGTGIAPENIKDYIGKIVGRQCHEDELVMKEDIIQ